MTALSPLEVYYGSPPSSNYRAKVSDVVRWMEATESLAAGGGLSYINSSLPDLEARQGVADDQFALIVSSAAEAGVYERVAGEWQKIAPLPAIFGESIAAAEAAAARDAAALSAGQAANHAADALASKEAAVLIANFDPDDYYKTASGASGWGLRNLQGLRRVVDCDKTELSAGVYGVTNVSAGDRPTDYGLLLIMPLVAGGESGTTQITQKYWPADMEPLEYTRHYREGTGWSDWYRAIVDTGDQNFQGAVRSERDLVAQNSLNDSVLRLNDGGTNVHSIRRKHGSNHLEIYGYDAAAELVEFKFEASGVAARIVPQGDVSNGANLLSRNAGDARYLRSWRSSAQAIVSGGRITLNHSLGAVPRFLNFTLKCLTAEHGYPVGAEAPVSYNGSNATNTRYVSARVTDSQIILRLPNDPAGFGIGHDDTGAGLGITNSNWEFYVEAAA